MVEVYVLQIPPKLNHEVYQRLLSSVSKTKREQIYRFHRIEDAYRTLFADLLIRSRILKRFNIANEKINFQKNLYGKPFLFNFPEFSFNISHSGEWIACVIDTTPIGVDVEKMKPIEFENVKRIFSKAEREDLLAKSSLFWLDSFYDLWTIKESFVKALGKGLTIPLNSITVKKYSDEHIEIIKDGKTIPYYVKQYNIGDNYKLSVCALKNKFPNQPKVIQCNTLIDEIMSFQYQL